VAGRAPLLVHKLVEWGVERVDVAADERDEFVKTAGE
jgi:pyrimidine deaminase RibD-like protein